MIASVLKQATAQIGQAVQDVYKTYQALPKEEQEKIAKYGEIYEQYKQIIGALNKLDWKFLEKVDKGLSELVRLVADYDYLEAVAGSTEEMQRVLGHFQKVSENIGKAHAITGGVISGLVATGVLTMGLGTVIGGAIAFFASAYQGAKAIAMSGNRKDDLGHRLDRLNKKDEFQNEIYWKGLKILRSRPKCRAVSSGCAKEHLRYTAMVDVFNKVVEILLDIRKKLTFEKYLEDLGYKQVQALQKQEQQIAKTEISVKKAGFDWKTILFIALMILAGYFAFAKK
ncbi:MAG: hypothetical protein QXW01_03740 [Candidatus Aenigmatarchaeota archaeon]